MVTRLFIVVVISLMYANVKALCGRTETNIVVYIDYVSIKKRS